MSGVHFLNSTANHDEMTQMCLKHLSQRPKCLESFSLGMKETVDCRCSIASVNL